MKTGCGWPSAQPFLGASAKVAPVKRPPKASVKRSCSAWKCAPKGGWVPPVDATPSMVLCRHGGGTMTQRSRLRFTAEEKRELWSRWRAGESLSEIGRALSRQPRSIHRQVAANGGYVPATRRRAARVLSLAEREEISRGLAGGLALRLIARRLGRSPSTVSREVARHGGSERYRAAVAGDLAADRRG